MLRTGSCTPPQYGHAKHTIRSCTPSCCVIVIHDPAWIIRTTSYSMVMQTTARSSRPPCSMIHVLECIEQRTFPGAFKQACASKFIPCKACTPEVPPCMGMDALAEFWDCRVCPARVQVVEVIPDDGTGRGPKVIDVGILLWEVPENICVDAWSKHREAAVLIQCSIKLVDQASGEDLDPTNL
eukprot:scaffold83388_cov19-Tisochrysis_lutea.AAC.1